MDPLSGLSLAANILQFIEFTRGLLSTSVEVYIRRGSHRARKSLRAALKLAWRGEGEIEKLASRLKDRPSRLTLHIYAISK
ncbi:hypothetical protein F5Y05DRAFT_368154 [Hypoxylon sp. FL0543]|nr:hypothetical protein F5Y05DRAFT_368154 [Hypoxylon sp. FL0543]